MASVQPQPTTPQAPPAKVEISWDDALDGKFPPTRQQRFQQAAVQAVEQLHEHADVPVTRDRLTKALDLVLTNAVSLLPDSTARVRSGSHTYHLAPDCTCEDAQRRGKGCKHALAVLIQRRATALLEDAATSPAAPSVTPPAVVPTAADPATLSAPASASWDVHEAPASACFRFRVGNLELMYTLRGVGDAELQARIKDTLPLLQDMLEGCEARAARRAAEREAAQVVQAQQPTSAPADLQTLLQQAVQQALAAQSTGAAPANGQAQPAAANGTAPFCQAHQTLLELRSNDRGSWWSHWVASEKRYCKGE